MKGASQATGLGNAEASEPHSGLGPTGAIPRAEMPQFTPVDFLVEQMGEALFELSDSLRESGFLNNAVHHARYESVVIAWRGLTAAHARGEVR